MDAVEHLLASLSSTAPDAKALGALGIALARCETALSTVQLDKLLTSLKSGLRSANATVSSASLAAAGALFPLLTVTPNHAESSQLKHALVSLTGHGGIFDRLGDRDKVRELAARALLAASRACISAHAAESARDTETPLILLDRLIKEQGLASKAARVREMTLHHIAQTRSKYPGQPLRPYVIPLVNALEDQDQQVRDAAKETIVSVFSDPSVAAAARSDLKLQMTKHGVRKTTADAILSRVLGRNQGPTEGSNLKPQSPDMGSSRTSSGLAVSARDLNGSASSNASVGMERGNTVKAVYVASEKDLEQVVAKMQPAFAGVENEHNWKGRETNVAILRGLLVGEVHMRYLGPFLLALKTILDGLLRTLISLRTTVMSNTCHLFGELAIALKTAFDPFVDAVLPTLLKMAAQTKKLAVTASQSAVEAIIINCSYREKILTMLHAGMAEKVISFRQAAIVQIRTLIKAHGAAYQQFIQGGTGLSLLEHAIKQGLTDANPSVRESARSAFWEAHAIWPQRFDGLKAGLDAGIRLQLEKAGGSAPTSVSPSKPRTSVRQVISARRSEAHVASVREQMPPVPRQRTVSASMVQPSMCSQPESPPRSLTDLPAISKATNLAAASRENSRSPTEAPKTSQSASMTILPNLTSDPELISNERAPFSPGRRSLNGTNSSPKQGKDRLRQSSVSSDGSSRGRVTPLVKNGDFSEFDAVDHVKAQRAEQAAVQLLQLTSPESKAATPAKATRPSGLTARGINTSVFVDSPAQPNHARYLKAHLLVPGESWWLRIQRSVGGKLLDASEVDSLIARLGGGSATESELLSLATTMKAEERLWADKPRAERLLSGLETMLRGAVGDSKLFDAGLYILQVVLEHQAGLLSGRDMMLFDLLLDLRRTTAVSNHIKLDGVAGLFGMQVDPLYGVRCLRTSVERILRERHVTASQESGVLTLALRLQGLLFRRLPAVVLEEEVSVAGPLLIKGLNRPESMPRSAANATLSVAAILLGGERVLFALLPQLNEEQKALIIYYCANSRQAGEEIAL